jgi:hypothetical protein
MNPADHYNVAVNHEVSNYVNSLWQFLSNSHLIQMKNSKQPWRARQNIYLEKYNFLN